METDDDKKRLGNMIRTARKNTQLSIYQLGQITGVGSAAISSVENGERWPDEPVWECICEKIGLPLAMLKSLKDGPRTRVRLQSEMTAAKPEMSEDRKPDSKVIDLATYREKKWQQTSLFPTD
jgi:transcriptional regulator with XRE-family HTH domain